MQAYTAKVDASKEDMGVLKTLFDVDKRPDQFPAVRIFKLGKLYKKDIPTPNNYEGEAPGLVLSNFLLVCTQKPHCAHRVCNTKLRSDNL